MAEKYGTILYIYNPFHPKSMSRKLFEQLAKDHYILYFNGKLVVTNKFLREFEIPPVITAEEREAPQELRDQPKELGLIVQNTGLIIPTTSQVSPLLDFIKKCEVPEKVVTRTGSYWTNKYSKKAEDELIKVLKKGYQLDILVASTKLYYKSGGQPKAISNFILEGTWVSFYTDMVESLKQGTVEAHINKNLNKDDEEGFSRYKR